MGAIIVPQVESADGFMSSKIASNSAPPVLRAQNVRKRFGKFEAVGGINFAVERGQCVGLLGPNGAGKTTTMRMIMGLSTVTSGTLCLFGTPVHRMRRDQVAAVGLVPQEDNLDPELRVDENLTVYGRYFGLSRGVLRQRVPKLLEFMQLHERRQSLVHELSGGMKRRLIIARALIAEPDFIVLDEPTTGLDPQARVLIWKQLLALKEQNKTLLLTTHYMDEAERLCDHIIIIDGGQVLAEGSPGALISEFVKGNVFEIAKPLTAELSLASWDHEDIGDAVLVYVEDAAEFARVAPPQITYLHRPANLEDVFLRLTGRALREP